MLKARFTVPSTVEPSILETLDHKFEEHLSFKLCEDIAIALCELFKSQVEESSPIATIEKYIMENYKDPSLCLNKISDELFI